MGELDSLLCPGIRQTDVELYEVEVQRLEPVELTVELGLAGGGDHHRVVDALAIDRFAGGEKARPNCCAGVVGLAMRECAVGIVGDGPDLGDAIGKPEAAEAVTVVDGVVGVGVGVVLPKARHDGGITGFDGTSYTSRRSGAMRR